MGLAKLCIDGEETYIEVDDYSGEQVDGVRSMGEVSIDLPSRLDPLLKSGNYIVERLKALSPDKVELTFGIKASGEGKVLCFAKAGAEAQFSVKLSWDNTKDA
jgi:hypothetical protein